MSMVSDVRATAFITTCLDDSTRHRVNVKRCRLAIHARVPVRERRPRRVQEDVPREGGDASCYRRGAVTRYFG